MTIASAIILAVAAAFAAPLVLDWTQFRTTFEAQAARTLGVPVVIRGPIDARLLPSPSFVLRDVSLGLDAGGTGVVAGELSGRLSLGALLSGKIVADQLTLERARIRLVLGADGRIALPTGAGRPAPLTIANLAIRQSNFELIDRAGGHEVQLGGVNLAGDLGGLAGPLRLEGELEAAGVRRTVRLTLAAAGAEGAARLRLGVQDVGSPFSIDADGTLAFVGGRPAFQGKASLSMRAPGAAGPPLRDADGSVPARDPLAGWSLSGTVNATQQAIDVTHLALALGSGELPVELSGSGRYVAAAPAVAASATATAGTTDTGGSRLDLTLAARQIDLGAATGGAAPLAALNRVARTVAPLADLARSGSLDLSTDTVLLGGAPMRSVRAGLDWSPAGWRARTLEARLPGRASLALSGRLPQATGAGQPIRPPADAALFTGDMVLSAEDLPAFAGWAAPEATALLAGLPGGAASLKAAIAVGEDRVALDRLTLTVGDQLSLAGTAAYAFPTAATRGRVDAALSTAKVDLDPLIPPLRRLIGFGGQRFDVALSFAGTDVRLTGVNAAGADLILRADAGGVGIERLAIRNFGGLDLSGSGRLAALDAVPGVGGGIGGEADGRFEARLTGARTEGLPALARALGVPQAEPLIAALGPSLAPLDVTMSLASDTGRLSLDARGRLGLLSGEGAARFGAGGPPEGRFTLEASDGSAVLGKLGVPGLRAGLGPAQVSLTLGETVGSTLEGRLAFAGAALEARGKVRWEADGRLAPDLALTLRGADLARLFPMLSSGGLASVPAELSASLTREGTAWRLGGLSGAIAGERVDGQAAYLPDETIPITIDLALDRWNLPAALALATGRVTGGAAGAAQAGWPDGRFGPPALGRLNASVKLSLRQLDLPAGLVLDLAKLNARLSEGVVSVEDLSGALAGGRLSGRFDLRRRGENLQLDGHLALADAESGPLLRAADVQRPGAGGKVTLALDLTGSGRSPRGIAASLQGQGSLVLDGLEIAYTDPRALQYVMLATERGLPPEQARIVQLLNEGLSRGPLKLPRIESALSVVNGVARSSTARAALGDQRFALSGAFDIPALSFETTLEIEDLSGGGSGAAGGAPPGAGVQWRGPIAAPERRFDITALIAAINMRALERETRRLEAQYGRTPLTDGGQPTDEMPRAAPPPPPVTPPPVIPQAAPQAPPQPAPPQPAPRAAAPSAPRPAPVRPAPAYGLQYPQPGSAAPPLAPPVDIPMDPLRSPIMAPPLAP
nr:AsmA family protein [Ancylobacter radicis]